MEVTLESFVHDLFRPYVGRIIRGFNNRRLGADGSVIVALDDEERVILATTRHQYAIEQLTIAEIEALLAGLKKNTNNQTINQ